MNKLVGLLVLTVFFVNVNVGMAQSLESFDEPLSFSPGPGEWFTFSCDESYVTFSGALSGGALVLEKEPVGFGCGAQYAFAAPQDWTGKQVSFWVKIDTTEFTSVNFQIFDANDEEQWEQKVSQVPQGGAWVEFVATISPEHFVNNGNGGIGDGALDITQINKLNLIAFNNGEIFRRTVMFDEMTLRDVPTTETLIESFEDSVTVEPPSYEPTPGTWNSFSGDTSFIATDGPAHDGTNSFVVQKSGVGFGAGIQYALPAVEDWTGKAMSFWVYVDTVEFSGYNFQVFDAVDDEQWEQTIITNPLQGGWQQVVAHIDPAYFQNNGNGPGIGDGQLDVTQIKKFNVIFFNRGENFTREFRADDFRLLDSPIRPLTAAHQIENFDNAVFEPPSYDPTPGLWNSFSADTFYVTPDGGLTGAGVVIEKSPTGFGTGIQYGLPEIQNWRGKQVSFWVHIDSTEFTSVNFQVFDANDDEQWEQKVSQSLQTGTWVEYIVTISPEYFVNNGNGPGLGDGKLDVTQIKKFNLIIFNSGEIFKRTITVDEFELRDLYADDTQLESFENEPTFEPPSYEPTPGTWNSFSADSFYVTNRFGHDGQSSVKVVKSGVGFGTGLQYALPATADWTKSRVTFWVFADTVEFSGYNFQVFDANDDEQWEQAIVANPLQAGWQEVVANIEPVYFQNNGNGPGVGDGQLDVTQIKKFNVIMFNRGENFTRTFYVDDFRIDGSPLVTGINDSPVELPVAFALGQNYPNPFNPSTTIEYRLEQAADINLTIYNIMGQKVRTLVQGTQRAGAHAVQWSGRNDFGRVVSSGTYFYVLRSADNVTLTRKLMLLK